MIKKGKQMCINYQKKEKQARKTRMIGAASIVEAVVVT
jgi:hypothetical protein